MPRSDLDDEVLEILRFQQFDRHTALTRAHADRQAAFLIEIAYSHRYGFPCTGRQCANGHIGEDQRIDPVNRRRMLRLHQLAILNLERQLLGRQYAAKWCTDIERMTGSIKRRVRHLRDTADHDAVERTLCIEVRTTTAFDRTVVLRKQRLTRIRVAYRTDCIVRADLLAHATATAEVRQAVHLLDDWAGNMMMHRIRLRILRRRNGLCLYLNLDGLERTGRHTAAAHRTTFGMIFYFPGKVIESHILRFYCFHLCTSRSLSITTISRSFG